MLKTSVLASAVALFAGLTLAALPTVCSAQSSLSFNASLTTDYRYRGLSQSRLKPAIQAGVDYAASNGFYLGAWGSSIQWIKDANGDAPVELDLYGGWKGEVAKGLTLDVGALSYQYPRHHLSPSPETLELYGALSFGPVTAKYSHSLSNLFGFPDSKGSRYLDLSASFDVGAGVMLSPHIGRQTVAKLSSSSYTDYSLSVSKDFDGWVPSLSFVGTNSKAYLYGSQNLGKKGLVLAVKKNF